MPDWVPGWVAPVLLGLLGLLALGFLLACVAAVWLGVVIVRAVRQARRESTVDIEPVPLVRAVTMAEPPWEHEIPPWPEHEDLDDGLVQYGRHRVHPNCLRLLRESGDPFLPCDHCVPALWGGPRDSLPVRIPPSFRDTAPTPQERERIWQRIDEERQER